MLPNAKEVLAALLVLSFLGSWNDFVWPIYVLFSDASLTLPVGLTRLQRSYTIDYPVIMAGATMSAASRPRIGLYTGGGENPAVEAHFSDLIFVNASWPS